MMPMIGMQPFLEMYSVHTGWTIALGAVALGIVVGVIGFAVGLAMTAPEFRPRPKVHRNTPHQAA